LGGKNLSPKINSYLVEGTLVVDQLGTNNLLEPLLDQKDNTTYSLSVNLLDFEKLRQEQIGAAFLLDILELESQSRTRLQIIVKNIDDESPELQTASCVMEVNIISMILLKINSTF
jgi:hypothetical protein